MVDKLQVLYMRLGFTGMGNGLITPVQDQRILRYVNSTSAYSVQESHLLLRHSTPPSRAPGISLSSLASSFIMIWQGSLVVNTLINFAAHLWSLIGHLTPRVSETQINSDQGGCLTVPLPDSPRGITGVVGSHYAPRLNDQVRLVWAEGHWPCSGKLDFRKLDLVLFFVFFTWRVFGSSHSGYPHCKPPSCPSTLGWDHRDPKGIGKNHLIW